MSKRPKDELRPQGSAKRTPTRSAKAKAEAVRGGTTGTDVTKDPPPKSPDPIRGGSTGTDVTKDAPPKSPDPIRGGSTGTDVTKDAPPKSPDPVRGS